jgi:signal transduction histidine kinase
MISRLDQSFRQMKQFSSDASHELKTPLTILKGEVEVMLRKERTSQEYQQTLKSNLEEINRMSQIVEDLLLLSKADTGEIQLNRKDINLTEIVAEVVAQMNILARSRELYLTASNHQQDFHIFGDALRIRELFMNLIENGIKYTEEGGSVHITLQEEFASPARNNMDPLGGETGRFVKIIVSDTGIGIAEEDRERIFNRFFRVDKARSREQGGSGLGLSISKWIVEAHQGEIKVESELGKGSSFIVRLPLSSHRIVN